MVGYSGVQTTIIMYLRTVYLRINLRLNNIFCYYLNFAFLSLLIIKSSTWKSVSSHLQYRSLLSSIVFCQLLQHFYYSLFVSLPLPAIFGHIVPLFTNKTCPVPLSSSINVYYIGVSSQLLFFPIVLYSFSKVLIPCPLYNLSLFFFIESFSKASLGLHISLQAYCIPLQYSLFCSTLPLAFIQPY